MYNEKTFSLYNYIIYLCWSAIDLSGMTVSDACTYIWAAILLLMLNETWKLLHDMHVSCVFWEFEI